jgi:hypothetical protein
MSKFSLGKVVATPHALEALAEASVNPLELIRRHVNLDPGDLCADDQKTNLDAVIRGGRVFSAYKYGEVKFWVITEADRSSTCILLPEEY